MAATAHRDVEVQLSAERDRGDDVGDARALRDQCRIAIAEHAVKDIVAAGLVGGVART
jgi:hypothetical protein